ncbi:MAG: MFS transporter [Candidatus Binataceae bacterium]
MSAAHLHAITAHERDSPHAWRTVAAGFLACFTLFGVAYSFGAFFKPMAEEFGASREAISAIFSITSFLYFLLGPATGHLADRFGPRPVVAVGALAMGAGLIATGSIRHLWFGYLTYGLGVGIGVACCYVPLVAVVSGWFLKRRNTALGIAVSGIGAGTLAVAPLAAVLIEHFGWRMAYVILGIGATLALLGCAWLAEAPPVELEAPPPPPLGNKLKTRDFVILYIAAGLWTIATAVPFVFLQPYARDNQIGEVAAATLVGIIGFASTAGRLGLGVMADRMGIIRLYQICILVLGLCFLLWLFGHSYGPLVAFALLMGASYGGAVTLTPAVLAERFGTQGLGLLLGTLYTSSAIGTLLGPPFAGAIIDHTGSYTLAVIFTGATSVLAFFILLPLGSFPRGGTVDGATPRTASD